jgi:hypothetical protein
MKIRLRKQIDIRITHANGANFDTAENDRNAPITPPVSSNKTIVTRLEFLLFI